jgi:hypothetical protein
MDKELPEILKASGGLFVRFRGRDLYSRQAPRSLPERSAAALVIPPASLILCASPLLGYGLDILLERMDSSSALLCAEAEPCLLELAATSIPVQVRNDPRFRLLGIDDRGRPLSDIGPSLPYRRCILIELTGGSALHREAYRSLASTLQTEIHRFWANRATSQAMGRLWARNLIANIPRLAESAPLAALQEAARGRALIVCGAGPSLETALPLIRDRRQELFILAVDTALSTLGAMGIRPDAAVCLEAQVVNLRDFIGCAPLPFPLVADLVSHPGALRLARSGFHLISSEFSPLGILERLEGAGLRPETFPPLGSVGVAALRIGLALRDPQRPLMVSGLDFSFPPGKTHARGSAPLAGRNMCRWRLGRDAGWEAGLRPGVFRLEAGKEIGRASILSDPALSGYAALAAEEAKPFRDALRDMRSSGMDLGIDAPPVGMDPLSPLPSPIASLPIKGSATADKGAVHDFLSSEKRILLRLRAALDGRSPLSPEDLGRSLDECDYLYMHFPDAAAGARRDLSFLRRVAVEADSFLVRIQRSMDALA